MSVERDLAHEWRRQYEDGATVEQIALDASVSPQRVGRALRAIDTPMRPAHTRPGTKTNRPNKTADGIEGQQGAPVRHAVFGSPARTGYRRRGRR